jgi:hypothetical protein
MTVRTAQRLIADLMRSVRRVIRQTERRQRYRRLGWV